MRTSLQCGALTLLLLGAFMASAAVDARPKKPKIAVCTTDQVNRLAQATSQQTVNICAIQGRVWVCEEEGRAKCCGVNNDGSLGHCSSSVGYRSLASGGTVSGGLIPAAPASPTVPATPSAISK